MGYELKQELRLSQKLLMTPQLRMAIKMLQLSRLELEALVSEELQSNPVLEEAGPSEGEGGEGEDAAKEQMGSEGVGGVEGGEGAPEPAQEQSVPEMDWEAYLEDSENRSLPGTSFSGGREDDNYLENISRPGGSLEEHLLLQLKLSDLSEEEIKAGEFIIGNIDESGYLRVVDKEGMGEEEHEAATVNEIASQTTLPVEDTARVLEAVRGFDPAGVGAVSTVQCLLFQARRLPVRDTVVEGIISGHLRQLANRNYKAIAREMGISIDEVVEGTRMITGSLNPAPGAGFGVDESRTIIPDVYIQKVGDEYVVTLNEDGMPKLKISGYYRKVIKGGDGVSRADKGYIRDRLRSAAWLIKSVYQRQRTICRVAESIVKFQREFLDKGLEHLKPIVLKDVAEDIGMHESTISRVTSNKYAHTPRGIFELKYFFSTGMSRADGSDTTAEYVKEKLKDIIGAEDSRSPSSDRKVADLLKEAGIVLARRTVTKYREEMGILPAGKRKSPF
ncbi:MAG: RNA polymerase factor sigma-54 [Thermodesulfobacteriota bacterium]